MDVERVACFVDCFNLYHAVARLRRPELEWLDLRALMARYVRPRSQRIEAIYYFSAFAEWLPRARHRHAAYVAALRARGVTVVLGKFKTRDRWCPRCRRSWVGHEEKETDVNIALHLLSGAYQNEYDHAVLVSRDSDLVPAMRMLRSRFPDTRLTVVAPPLTGHSSEMLGLATAKTSIRLRHLALSLLPAQVRDTTGTVVAVRPDEYAPPSEG